MNKKKFDLKYHMSYSLRQMFRLKGTFLRNQDKNVEYNDLK